MNTKALINILQRTARFVRIYKHVTYYCGIMSLRHYDVGNVGIFYVFSGDDPV